MSFGGGSNLVPLARDPGDHVLRSFEVVSLNFVSSRVSSIDLRNGQGVGTGDGVYVNLPADQGHITVCPAIFKYLAVNTQGRLVAVVQKCLHVTQLSFNNLDTALRLTESNPEPFYDNSNEVVVTNCFIAVDPECLHSCCTIQPFHLHKVRTKSVRLDVFPNYLFYRFFLVLAEVPGLVATAGTPCFAYSSVANRLRLFKLLKALHSGAVPEALIHSLGVQLLGKVSKALAAGNTPRRTFVLPASLKLLFKIADKLDSQAAGLQPNSATVSTAMYSSFTEQTDAQLGINVPAAPFPLTALDFLLGKDWHCHKPVNTQQLHTVSAPSTHVILDLSREVLRFKYSTTRYTRANGRWEQVREEAAAAAAAAAQPDVQPPHAQADEHGAGPAVQPEQGDMDIDTDVQMQRDQDQQHQQPMYVAQNLNIHGCVPRSVRLWRPGHVWHMKEVFEELNAAPEDSYEDFEQFWFANHREELDQVGVTDNCEFVTEQGQLVVDRKLVAPHIMYVMTVSS